MSQFRNREKGFEAKFAHDQEREFKVAVRRNRLLGKWAAELMGLDAERTAAYELEVVKADLEEAGIEDVFRKLSKDLAAAGAELSEHQIRREIENCEQEARRQIEQQ